MEAHWPSFMNFRVLMLYFQDLLDLQWIMRLCSNLNYKCDVVCYWKLTKIILWCSVGGASTWDHQSWNSEPFHMNVPHFKICPVFRKIKENEKSLKNSNPCAWSPLVWTSWWENHKLAIPQVLKKKTSQNDLSSLKLHGFQGICPWPWPLPCHTTW